MELSEQFTIVRFFIFYVIHQIAELKEQLDMQEKGSLDRSFNSESSGFDYKEMVHQLET